MKKLLACILMVSVFACTGTAFAAGGNGSGGGTGGNKDEGLSVVASSVDEGQSISGDEAITLTFSKNVVNSKVKEANASLFSLQSASGEEISVEVVMADDQIEQDKKNDVVIQPTEKLEAGEYILTAKAGIESKNGTVMEKDYTLKFAVSGEVKAEETKAEEAKTAATGSSAPLKYGVIAIVACAIAAALFVVFKKKK